MGKKIKVEVEIPEGYDLVINGTDCKLVPKLILPKTWEEFCETYPIQKGECFLTAYSNCYEVKSEHTRNKDTDKVCIPCIETAEVFIAMIQLIQLRNCYNGDWKPDWTKCTDKYAICTCFNDTRGKVIIDTGLTYHQPHVLAFKSKELCDQFFKNFRDLIEIAKPLI